MSTSYDLLDLYASQQKEESGKYFGLSMVIHVALAVGSLFVVVPTIEKLNPETITIELQEEPPIVEPIKTLEQPKGEEIAATKGAEPVFQPAPSAPLEAVTKEKIAGPDQKSKVSKAKVAQTKSHVSGGIVPIATTAPSRAGIPETLEDIPAPELEEGVDVAQVGNLGDNEFENEFKNIDQSNEAAVRAQQAALDEEARLIADEKEAALQALEEENAIKAKAMEDALEATRNKNAAAIAQMKATERAAAEKAAREAQLAAAAAAKNRGTGENEAEGRGNGISGADQATGAMAGSPTGVRSLDQLKQMPGNPKPQYSVGSSRVDLQACKLEYSIVSPK